MKKRIKVVLISSCSIIALVMLVIFIRRERLYPSVIEPSCVEAPNVEVTAELQIDDKEEKIVCTVENHNSYSITCGEEYYLEIEKDGKWYEVADRRGKRTNEKDWNAIAQLFSPNKRSEFVVSLANYPELSIGNYRVVKYVFLPTTKQENDSSDIIIGLFEVKE